MTMDGFPQFAAQVAASFHALTAGPAPVFVVDVEPDTLWTEYLAAFPEGSNPTFKKRTEHDCSCCKQFVRRAGGVIAIVGPGDLRTVWGKAADEAPGDYRQVARRLHDLASNASIRDVFRVGDKEL